MNGPSPALQAACYGREFSHTPERSRTPNAIDAIRGRVSAALGIPEETAKGLEVRFALEPFVDRNGRAVAHEALVRGSLEWNPLRPPHMLPDPADREEAEAFDRFAFAFVCRPMPPDAPRTFVNVHLRTFLNPDFLAFCVTECRRNGASPWSFGFEILEHEPIRESDWLSVAVESYKKRGFAVAMDDFLPSGNNGPESLKTAGMVDIIKLDGAWTRNICSSVSDGSCSTEDVSRQIRAAVNGHIRTSKILAEHVETPEMLRILKEVPEISLFQGYLFKGRT